MSWLTRHELSRDLAIAVRVVSRNRLRPEGVLAFQRWTIRL